MNAKTSLLIASSCLVAGFLGGFMVGDGFSSPGEKGERSEGSHGGASSPHGHATTEGAEASRERGASGWWKLEAAADGLSTPGMTGKIIDALQLDDVMYGEARMLLLIESMRKEDFPAALEILRKAKTGISMRSVGDQGPSMWIAFWQRFGQVDPAGALAAALKAGDLNYARREVLEKHLFTGMSRADPGRAAEALLAHPELPHQERAVEGLMVSWATKDPGAAVAWAKQHLNPDQMQTALYATAWGTSTPTDISAATKLLTELPEDMPRMSVVNSLKSQIRQKESLPVPQILDFLAATRAVGAKDPAFELMMASRCAGRDAFAAANFFAEQPPEGERNYAGLKVVVSQWAQAQPEAAEAWAKGQENTPHYAVVAAQLVEAARQRNDAAAVERWSAVAGGK